MYITIISRSKSLSARSAQRRASHDLGDRVASVWTRSKIKSYIGLKSRKDRAGRARKDPRAGAKINECRRAKHLKFHRERNSANIPLLVERR